MLQVKKSHSCGIYAIFFQCYFMIETQVLMTLSDFSDFFLGIISWKGASLFNGGRLFFSWGEFIFKWAGGGSAQWGCSWGASVLMGGIFQKNHRWGVSPHPDYEKPCRGVLLFHTYFKGNGTAVSDYYEK